MEKLRFRKQPTHNKSSPAVSGFLQLYGDDVESYTDSSTNLKLDGLVNRVLPFDFCTYTSVSNDKTILGWSLVVVLITISGAIVYVYKILTNRTSDPRGKQSTILPLKYGMSPAKPTSPTTSNVRSPIWNAQRRRRSKTPTSPSAKTP